jgi:ADP-heptose:LPS heptosyltransferase
MSIKRTTLIIHPGALGDVLLSLPAIRLLRRTFANNSVGLLAGEEVGHLLRACGEVAEIFPTERRALSDLLTGPKALHPAMRDWLAGCDLAVCWAVDAEGRLREHLTQAGIRHIIVGSVISTDFKAMHQEERYLATLKDVPLHNAVHEALRLPSEVLEQGKSKIKQILGSDGRHHRIAVLHPGSGSRHKCVVPDVFAETVEWCTETGLIPLIACGPADDESVAHVLRGCTEEPPVLRHEPLLVVAGVLAQAALYLGHDSGLSHLAARLHVPSVVLFGPTDPQRWAPRGRHVTILSGLPCQCPTWEAVRACNHKFCLQVTAQTVIAACRKIFAGGNPLESSAPARLVLPSNLC